MYISFDPIYIYPLAEGHRFPMIKYELIPRQLLHEGVINYSDLHSPAVIGEDIVLLTHEQYYWESLRDLTIHAAAARRIGFPLSLSLIERELRIAGGTVDGAVHALNYGAALNVAGGTHHAGSNWGEGFCLLNDQAIAANFLLNNGLANRVLIVDLDVHQGNGTAEIFKKEARVFTFSMHAQNNFPFRKEISDLDIGLSDGTGDREYLNLLHEHLPGIVSEFKPDFIFYLSGVDVLATDKLGKLNLSIEGCRQRDQFVIGLCHRLKIPVQISMGGGYSPKTGDIVEAHCNTYKVVHDIYF